MEIKTERKSSLGELTFGEGTGGPFSVSPFVIVICIFMFLFLVYSLVVRRIFLNVVIGLSRE